MTWQAPKVGAIPTEEQALWWGGWRNIPEDTSDADAKTLRESYGSFMADICARRRDVHLKPQVERGAWVCITPESWTACSSYRHAVKLVTRRGLGVVDQAHCYCIDT